MGQSVQFFNIDAVLQAFTTTGTELWALSQGKQFLFKGNGGDELQSILQALADGGSTAIYTLQVYEGDNEVAAIKPNTPFDGSFNFKLTGAPVQFTPAPKEDYLLARVGALEDRLNDDRDDNTEIEGQNLSVFERLLGNPALAALLPILVEKIINLLPDKKSDPPKQINDNLTKVAGINDEHIIEKMEAIDPEIRLHLQKLLLIMQKNRALYDVLITQLKNLQL